MKSSRSRNSKRVSLVVAAIAMVVSCWCWAWLDGASEGVWIELQQPAESPPGSDSAEWDAVTPQSAWIVQRMEPEAPAKGMEQNNDGRNTEPATPAAEAAPSSKPELHFTASALIEAGIEEGIATAMARVVKNHYWAYLAYHRTDAYRRTHGTDNINICVADVFHALWPELGQLVSSKKIPMKVHAKENPNIGDGVLTFFLDSRMRSIIALFDTPHWRIELTIDSSLVPTDLLQRVIDARDRTAAKRR